MPQIIKRSRIRDELDRSIGYLSLLIFIPCKTVEDLQSKSDISLEAAKLIDDPVFTDSMIRLVHGYQGKF